MYNILKFDRARNCLRYLVKFYNIREMYIPYYLCDVIRHTLFEEGCKPIFYHIDDNFYPTENFPKESYILYPNYFGIFGENVQKLINIYPKLIVDNAHAFFDKPSGFACFNSGIKFGLGENAYLWIKDNGKNPSENTASFETENLKKKCRNTFDELHQTYSCINEMYINNQGEFYPFCYPLLAKTEQDADNIVQDLTKKGITIYRYWNPLPKSYNEYKFFSRLVPVPVV